MTPAFPVSATPVVRAEVEVKSTPSAAATPTPTPPSEEDTGPVSPQTQVVRERRKREVLKSLVEHASPSRFSEVQAVWNDVLQKVKAGKIQTYAWLMGGQPVMATEDTVLVTFRVQIHRDNVMKPDERALIETCLWDVVGANLRFQAILQTDWEAYQATVQPEAAPSETVDWVDDVVRRFGESLVEVRPDE